MSENSVENRNVKPEELLKSLNKPRMTMCVVISFVVHIVLLLVLSISFLADCSKYGTIHVKNAKKIEAKEEADKAEAARKAEALKRAEEAAQKKAEADKAKAESAKAEAEADKAKKESTPTMKAVNETSKERPSTSDMSLDIDLL